LFLETGENVAEILIHGGWARPYHGEKNKPWTLEELTTSPFLKGDNTKPNFIENVISLFYCINVYQYL